MATPANGETNLAYDDEGVGTPVVLLHGLTFDRRSWRPIIEQLDGAVRTIAIDLPAHGDSGGGPAPLDDVAARVHDLVAAALGVDHPVVVGHSMSGALACLYAAAYPCRGVVVIDNGPDNRPIAQLVRRLEPVLRGPGFTQAWQGFEDSLGLERIPEPARTLVLETHHVNQHVVVGYWETVLRTDPDVLQASIDSILRQLDVPCLAVFRQADHLR